MAQAPPTDATRAQPSDSDLSVGRELRRAREVRNISLQQVADETRISLRHLRSLEEDAFDRLPGRLYARNFVKVYAGFLGVDEEELLDYFDFQWRRLSEAEEASSREGSLRTARRRIAAVALVVAVAAIATALAWSIRHGRRGAEPARPEGAAPERPAARAARGPATPAAGSAPAGRAGAAGPSSAPAGPAPPPAARVGRPAEEPGRARQGSPASSEAAVEGARADRAPAEEAASSPGRVAPEPEPPTRAGGGEAGGESEGAGPSPDPPAEPTPAPQEPSPAPPASGAAAAVRSEPPVTVRLEFHAPSWIEVWREGDPHPLLGLKEAGDELTVEMDAPLRIHVGNAGGVDLFLDGKAARPLGGPGEGRTIRLDSRTWRSLLR